MKIKGNMFTLFIGTAMAVVVTVALLLTGCPATDSGNNGNTTATHPDAPTGITLTPEDGRVTVSWTAPENNGGAAITDYTVYWSTESGVTKASTDKKQVGGTGTTLVIDGLTNGTTYYFAVSASNSAGESDVSEEGATTPSSTAVEPDAPTGISLTPGNGQVTVSWSAPANNGGSPITDYTVYWGTGTGITKASADRKQVGGTGTTLVIDGLTNGTTYYFAVSASNSVGESTVSDEANTIPAHVPGAPTMDTLTPGDGKVTVEWTEPDSNGGSPITVYTVYWATASGVDKASPNSKNTDDGTTTMLEIDGLANSTQYYFAVSATNAVGEGAVSGERDTDTLPKNFVYVQGGTFWMGAQKDDATGENYDTQAESDESPVHQVTLSTFAISKYEVTYKEFIAFLNGAGVSSGGQLNGNFLIILGAMDVPVKHENEKFSFKGSSKADNENTPVINVTWYGAVEYANYMSEQDGMDKVYTVNAGSVTADFSKQGYRLPTEAEWEYAARGGTLSKGYVYSGSNTLGDVAWYWQNSGDTLLSGEWNYDTITANNSKSHEVGQLQANELGLFDMTGNVSEWCWNWFELYSEDRQTDPLGPENGVHRVHRGGSWVSFTGYLRSTNRVGNLSPEGSSNGLGFRLVL